MNLSKRKEGIVVPLMFLLTGISLIDITIFNQLTSTSLYLNIVVCVCVIASNNKVNRKYFVVIILAIAFALITLLIHSGGLGSILTFVIPLVYIMAFADAEISEKSIKYVKIICVVIVVYEFYYSFNYYGMFVYYIKGKINPNTVGAFSMYAFLYYTALSSQKSKKNKIFFVILLITSCITMINCESRMTLVSLIVGILLMSIKITNGRFYNCVSLALIILGTIFPHLYVKMYSEGVQFQILGKSLYTGREDIWLNMENSMNNNITALLFGLGSKSNLFINHDLNLHNNYLGIIVNFGLIGFVICFSFILHFIWRGSLCVSDSRHRKLLIIFISTVLLYGFTETSYLWASVTMLSFLCLGLSSNKFICDENDSMKNERNNMVLQLYKNEE